MTNKVLLHPYRCYLERNTSITMKKSELRASLAKIQPREELIETTINKINEHRLGITSERRMPTFAFATRLAAAFCALLLIVGLGIAANNTAPLTDSSNPQTRNSSVTDKADSGIVSHEEDDSRSALAEYARSQYTTWIIADGEIISCNIETPTDEQKENGILFLCTSQIVISEVSDSTLSYEQNFTSGEIIDANIEFYSNSYANDFVTSTQKNATFLLVESEGEEGSTWKIEAFIADE